MRMVRAVAGGDDVRIRRTRELVDHDAVVARQPGRARELDVRHDADADDRDVAVERLSCGRLDAGHARRASEPLDLRAALNRDAGGAMPLGVELRYFRTHCTR